MQTFFSRNLVPIFSKYAIIAPYIKGDSTLNIIGIKEAILMFSVNLKNSIDSIITLNKYRLFLKL